MLIGTSRMFSDRFCAVTTISSKAVPESTEADPALAVSCATLVDACIQRPAAHADHDQQMQYMHVMLAYALSRDRRTQQPPIQHCK
jgi:hypothetical protein